jgi:hypothetical protein
MFVGVVDHDTQPRSKGLKPAHDFRIGQIIGKYVEKDQRIRRAFVQKAEQDAARFKAKPRIRLSIALEGSSIEIKLRLADRRHDLALVRKVALIGLRAGEASREAEIEKCPTRGTIGADRRARGGFGKGRLVAVPEHRRHLVGHGAIERDAGNMRPAKHLDGRAHRCALGQRDFLLARLCRKPHALEREEVEDVTRPGGVADEILNAKADKVRFFQRVVDIKREQDHVLPAIELQRKTVGRIARDKVYGHCLAPIPSDVQNS